MKLANLIEDLRDNGAIQTGEPNYSHIVKNEYHCHLSWKWAACWYRKKARWGLRCIMLAVVKTPRIKIEIKGKISKRLLDVLKEEYGSEVQLIPDKEVEKVDIFETDWYKTTKEKLTPGKNMRIYRQNRGMM
jgi:hypothetical protein